MKLLEFKTRNNENHKKIIIIVRITKKNEINRISNEKYENHENLMNPRQNHENHEIIRNPLQNNENHEN